MTYEEYVNKMKELLLKYAESAELDFWLSPTQKQEAIDRLNTATCVGDIAQYACDFGWDTETFMWFQVRIATNEDWINHLEETDIPGSHHWDT